MRGSGVMPVRASGKYVATRFTIPAGHLWSYVRAFEYDIAAGGRR